MHEIEYNGLDVNIVDIFVVLAVEAEAENRRLCVDHCCNGDAGVDVAARGAQLRPLFGLRRRLWNILSFFLSFISSWPTITT